MFGPDLSGVKIKTVGHKPDRVEVEDIVSITSDYHRFVSMTLTADVMFVNGMPLLITLSRRIRLLTVEHIPSRTVNQLGSSLNKIVNLYDPGGFVVNVVLMDQ